MTYFLYTLKYSIDVPREKPIPDKISGLVKAETKDKAREKVINNFLKVNRDGKVIECTVYETID